MFECERLLGVAQSYELRGFIEAQIGAPCPCKVGEGCPLGLLAPAQKFARLAGRSIPIHVLEQPRSA